MRLPNLRALAVVATAAGVLTSFGSPASAADPVPATPATPPCATSDLGLREVSATGGTLPAAVYALRNRGAAACRISGGVGIRLFDAQGKPIPLRVGPNSTMPMLLTLAAGDEGSFTVTYGRPGTERCATGARIDVYLAPQLTPVSAATTFIGCALPSIRISNLRLGAPSPAPALAPSPAPSASPSAMSRLVS